MRTPESITKLLYDLYTGHEWEELEEYFIVAEQLILLHGGHFVIFTDLSDETFESGDYPDIGKYSDSEEAWREEINKVEDGCYQDFEAITNTFIYFNK